MICGYEMFAAANFVLSLTIFAFGCWAYIRTKNKVPFYIGTAFGLFSLSHLISMVGMEAGLKDTVILVRAFSYFIVLTAIYHMGLTKSKTK